MTEATLPDSVAEPPPLTMRNSIRGGWILVIGLIIQFIFSFVIFTDFIDRNWVMGSYRKDVPSITDDTLPEGEYLRLSALSGLKGYVRQSVVEGVLAGIGMVLSIMFSVYFWRRCPSYSLMNLWMAILHNGGKLAFSLYLFYTCSNIFDPPLTTMPWTDFNLYISAKMRWTFGFMGAFAALGYPLIFYFHRKFGREDKQTGSTWRERNAADNLP